MMRRHGGGCQLGRTTPRRSRRASDPQAPAGKESNQVPTDLARKFELIFRLCTPTGALFEKERVLPDIEKVQP
jgi:hypothetical protein